jgi:ABC-type Na+ efflux pump permease subunit
VRKNFHVVVADWKALFFSYLLPVVLASITGLAFSGVGSGGGATKLNVGYVDLDATPPVKKLVEALEASESLALEPVADEEKGRTLVRKRKKLAVLVFPKGSGEKLRNGFFSEAKAEIRLLIDPSRQAEQGMLQGILMREVMKSLSSDMMNPNRAVNRMKEGLEALEADDSMEAGERGRWTEFMRAGVDMFERLKEASAAEEKGEEGETSPHAPDFSEPFRLEVEKVTGKKAETGQMGGAQDMFAQTFSGTGVMFLLFGVMGAAINLVQERQRGTLKRILTTPVSRLEILLGEAVFYFLFSMTQLAVLFGFAKLFFHIPFDGSKAGFVLIAAATGAAVTGFGILVAAVGKGDRRPRDPRHVLPGRQLVSRLAHAEVHADRGERHNQQVGRLGIRRRDLAGHGLRGTRVAQRRRTLRDGGALLRPGGLALPVGFMMRERERGWGMGDREWSIGDPIPHSPNPELTPPAAPRGPRVFRPSSAQ